MCAIISPYCNEDKSSVFGINESVLFISILSALLLCLIFYHVVWALSDLLLCHVFVLCCMALSDLLLCHVFVLRCTGHQIWLVLAMDIFVLCFLATIVFTSIHVVGLENYMVKMESIFFFYMGLCLILWNVVENCLT